MTAVRYAIRVADALSAVADEIENERREPDQRSTCWIDGLAFIGARARLPSKPRRPGCRVKPSSIAVSARSGRSKGIEYHRHRSGPTGTGTLVLSVRSNGGYP